MNKIIYLSVSGADTSDTDGVSCCMFPVRGVEVKRVTFGAGVVSTWTSSTSCTVSTSTSC